MSVEIFDVSAFDQRGHSHLSSQDNTVMMSIVGDFYSLMGAYSCAYCDAYPSVEPAGEGFRSTTACEYPGGGTYDVTIDVPSGVMVAVDDLRGLGFEDPEDIAEALEIELPDYNSALGRRKFAELYVEQNVAYGAVGNTCPSVFRDTATGDVIIANGAYDEDTDEEITPDGWVKVGAILTDLWAYSITDADTFDAKNENTEGQDYVNRISVTPGRYRFTHYADQAGFDRHDEGLVVFARGTLVTD